MATKKLRTDLDGKTWSRYSISVWSDIDKNKEEKSLKHPAMFPVMLVERLIKVFTHPGDLVLDPFVGSGSALLASYRLGRSSLGLDISSDYIKLGEERIKKYSRENDLSEGQKYVPVFVQENAINLGQHVEEETVSLCVTSPPYWNILGQKRTADGKEERNYGNLEKDLSQIDDYKDFIKALGNVFSKVFNALKPGGYLVVNVMDIRKGPQFYPLHMDLTLELKGRGYMLDDIIIWDRRREYNNLRPLGYPYVFRINKVHEFLLIFRKEL
ncbi:MAG: site-specific DNA-methyltransferase [Candidatus Syntrophonatronum acetioxidans]|uniref:Methyltransferase n=1 Tax=Candidatus Syntrophonatronum acetioxidans TaxID=1795816 RepID=A0A424YAN6_9FIRM|nr:MAG: site-specific DNA-methyltransferase [Candidatus Syntrophonatronum acetioxidans]